MNGTASDSPVHRLLTQEEIARRVRELGAEITRDYAGRDPILIGVLKGSLIFLADLSRAIDCPLTVDFMSISSYSDGARSSGVVRILKDLDEPLTGRHVILVEDIIDTGLTLTYILNTLRAREPASLEICGLLDKSVRRIVEVPLRYVGFEIPDEFVIGYGLDHKGRFRNLPDIYGVPDLASLADPDRIAQALA